MKAHDTNSKELFEIVIPFNGEPQGLYDDCPVCQELKRRIGSGEVEAHPLSEVFENIWGGNAAADRPNQE